MQYKVEGFEETAMDRLINHFNEPWGEMDTYILRAEDKKKDQWSPFDKIPTKFSFTVSSNQRTLDEFNKLKNYLLEQAIPHLQELRKVEPALKPTLIRVLACFEEYPTLNNQTFL